MLKVGNHKSESLDELFSRLIAEKEGVTPAEVTLEFIRRRRYERRYLPVGILEFSEGLRYVPLQEIEETQRRIDALLKSF